LPDTAHHSRPRRLARSFLVRLFHPLPFSGFCRRLLDPFDRVLSICDFAIPEPGFYGEIYNYGYTTDRLNDSSGNKIKSVTGAARSEFD
jgi:hypothetical protein